MNKQLILPLSLLLLASCGGGSSGTTEGTSSQTGWNETARNNMTSSIGIILPYIELDNTQFYIDDNLFQINGEGNDDDLEAYRKLLGTDFNYLSTKNNLIGEPTLTFESKNLDRPVRIEMEIFPEENADGVEIDHLMVTAYRYISWPSEDIEALGISDVPQYDGNNKIGSYVDVSENIGDYVSIHVFEGSSDNYAETLQTAGFIIGNYGDEDEWHGAYNYLNFAYKNTSYTFIQYYQDGDLGLVIRIFIYAYDPSAPET